MTTIAAQVPDYLAVLAHEAAAKEKTTVDQIIALALSAQLSAWKCATKWTPAPNAAVPKISATSSPKSPPRRLCRGMNYDSVEFPF